MSRIGQLDDFVRNTTWSDPRISAAADQPSGADTRVQCQRQGGGDTRQERILLVAYFGHNKAMKSLEVAPGTALWRITLRRTRGPNPHGEFGTRFAALS